MITQKQINKYIKDIKKQLICPTAESRQMLKELQANIFDFVQDNPDADKEQLIEQFGTPEEIAKLHLADADMKKLKRATAIRRMLIATAVAVLVIVAVSFAIIIIDAHGDGHGAFYVKIEEGVTYVDIANSQQ